MTTWFWGRTQVMTLVAATMLTAGLAGFEPIRAQEGDTPNPTASQPAAKGAKKAGARLPPYFGEVVTQEQREKIYGLQSKFLDQIQKLREEITALEAKQKEEVAAVLTADQRAQVEKMAAEAKGKRTKKGMKDQPAPPADSPNPAATN